MFLERLRDFHARIQDELIPSYHKKQGCRWILEIGADGAFQGFVETGKTKRSATDFHTPYRKRSGRTPPPYLLVDKPAYVLGLPRNDEEKWKKKAAQRHKDYVNLVVACNSEVDHPALDAFVVFLEWGVTDALVAPAANDMKKDDLIIPRIDGLLLTQIPEVQQFWIKREDARAAEKSDLTAECLLCGETRPIARTHPVELVVGPDRVGLVTGNAKAFLSHGLEQSEIAPVCQRCARTYGEALRYLLEQDRHHQRISDVTWVYWTAEATDFTPFNTLMEADARNIEALLKAPYKAQPSGDVDETAFYAAALTSNISRLAIRSWVATTVGEVKQNIAQHFAQMRLDGPDGSHYHGVYALAGSTVRDLNDLPPHTIETLLSHALMGTRLPKTLLQKAIRRAQVEGAITHPRAALLKLVLLSNQSNTVTPMLNPTHDNPAYHCGRLLAVLESIQKRAISPNTTLVDRYYGTASTAPASVFGNLMRDAQTHLSKLRRGDSDGGLGFHFDKQLGAIMGQMDGFPRTLNTEDQALFALGYYQQKWHRNADNEDSDQEEGTNASATAVA